jgi:hypothetical protein
VGLGSFVSFVISLDLLSSSLLSLSLQCFHLSGGSRIFQLEWIPVIFLRV